MFSEPDCTTQPRSETLSSCQVDMMPVAYSPPSVDRIRGIWGSHYTVPKAIFLLLKGEHTPLAIPTLIIHHPLDLFKATSATGRNPTKSTALGWYGALSTMRRLHGGFLLRTNFLGKLPIYSANKKPKSRPGAPFGS